MNDNTELEAQNFSRFLQTKELNPAPRLAKEYDRLTLSQLKQDVPRLIFCRKNSKTLQDLIENSRFMKKRVIIDDEADYASVNTADVSSNASERTRINMRIREILARFKKRSYLAYTATPFANIFIDPDSDNNEWEDDDLFPKNFSWKR